MALRPPRTQQLTSMPPIRQEYVQWFQDHIGLQALLFQRAPAGHVHDCLYTPSFMSFSSRGGCSSCSVPSTPTTTHSSSRALSSSSSVVEGVSTISLQESLSLPSSLSAAVALTSSKTTLPVGAMLTSAGSEVCGG